MNFFRMALPALTLLVFVGCTDSARTDAGRADAMDAVSNENDSDRAAVLDALAKNAQAFEEMVADLTPEQLAYQESPERWSIAGVAEHLVITEGIFAPMIKDLLAQEGNTAAPDSGATDEMIVAVMADRTQKFQAPDEAQPTGKFSTSAEIIAAFETARTRTIEMVEASDVDLRTVYADHPALGTLDGAQWVLFVASHADRHLAQMQQVKDDAGFPNSAM